MANKDDGKDPIMVLNSVLSTLGHSPVSPEVIESSTQWSDVFLEEFHSKIHFQSPPTLVGRYGYTPRGTWKTRLRKSSKFVWISFFFLIFLWWATDGTQKRMLPDETDNVETESLDGLKFIDGHHPYIRVRQPSLKCKSRCLVMAVVCWPLVIISR